MPILYTFLALFYPILIPGGFEASETDSVNSSFIMGIEDLVWQTGWDYASMERMSVMINTDEYGYYGPQPAFMLDGIPFEPGFFGVHYAQLFPLSLFRIENLETFHGAGIRNGQPFQAGLMKLESEPLPRGISLFGSGQLGHNSGEPGPWVFDPERVTPNVERFGPWLDAGLSLRLGNWYAKGSLRYHDYVNIDEFIQNRMINMRGIPEENIWLRVDAISTLGLVETGYLGDRIELRAQGIRSVSTDFLFFQPLGREIPTGFETEQYSALARVRTTASTGIRALYQHRQMATAFRRNIFDFEIDWEKKMQTIRGSVYLNRNRAGFEAGLEHEISEITARGISFDQTSIPLVFLHSRFKILNWLTLSSDQIVRFSGKNRGISSNSVLDLHPAEGWKIGLSGGYSELLPEDSNPLELWINQGYDLLSHLNITAAIPDNIQPNRLVQLGITNAIQLHRDWNLDLSFQFFRHLSLQIPFQNVHYDLSFSTQPGMFTHHADETGERISATVRLQHQTAYRIKQSAQLSYRASLNGSNLYQQYWKMTPAIRFQHTTLYSPYPDLELQLDVQYLSERTWPEFSRLDGELNRSFHIQYPFKFFTYSNTLPQHIRIDIRVSKWLWQQRLRVALQLKNILNKDYQTHPIGVREGFGYMSRLEIRF